MGRVVTFITTAAIFTGFAVALLIAFALGSASHADSSGAAQSAGIHISLIWFGTGGTGLAVCAILVLRARLHATRKSRRTNGRLAVGELAQS